MTAPTVTRTAHPPKAIRVAALTEALSMAVLLTNRAFLGADSVAAVVGPLHGMTYVLIVTAGFLARPLRAGRWYSLVPGIGGALMLRRVTAARRDRQDDAS